MYILGTLIGTYAYGIFFLGLCRLLYHNVIILYSIIFLLLSVIFFKKRLLDKKYIAQILSFFRDGLQNTFSLSLLLPIILLAAINLISSLAPDLAFDSLWYHLTLPKLYLINHAIIHISGGLMTYSDMPKIGELLYTSALAFGDERLANLIQFGSGLFCVVMMYSLSRKYMSRNYALVASVIFYSNIAVAWESTTAYIDLIRTVFEILALWSFLEWFHTRHKKFYYFSSVFTGFAITTKLLAIGTLVIFLLMIWLLQKSDRIRLFLLYAFIAILIPSPWFIFSFIHTGNPVYPFFTTVYPTNITANIFNPLYFLQSVFHLFTASSDPISPLYLIVLPLLFWKYKTFPEEIQIISWYSVLALFIWYITPQTGGGRFIIPYLPAFSILISYLMFSLTKNASEKRAFYKHILTMTVIIIAMTTIIYRGIATMRYVPVAFGFETKSQFLSKNLNFSYGDFYDTDGYLKKHIKQTDTVLLYGFHNLYYIDFSFIDSSWVQKGDTFNYIAVQNAILPIRFKNWKKIYANPVTKVVLYTDNKRIWVY